MSEWQREKERRRQELLAKRSKVMNRLLELRLEKEGEGGVGDDDGMSEVAVDNRVVHGTYTHRYMGQPAVRLRYTRDKQMSTHRYMK